MQLSVWMLCGFLLLDNHNNSSSTHHYTLSHNHALPHDHTANMCFACLPEANGHQAKSWKDCMQRNYR